MFLTEFNQRDIHIQQQRSALSKIQFPKTFHNMMYSIVQLQLVILISEGCWSSKEEKLIVC